MPLWHKAIVNRALDPTVFTPTSVPLAAARRLDQSLVIGITTTKHEENEERDFILISTSKSS